jgi:hypothetical protein
MIKALDVQKILEALSGSKSKEGGKTMEGRRMTLAEKRRVKCEGSNREILRDKVVEMVKEFVVREGGISHSDIEFLFGVREVGSILAELQFTFS